MEGTIQELSVSDLLQIFMSASKTGTLKLKHADQQGAIYIKDGEAIHAQCGGLNGEEALQDMVLWADGEFSFTSKLDTPRQTIMKKSTGNILISTNKIQDDLREAIGKYGEISLNSLVYAESSWPSDISEELKFVLDKTRQVTSITNVLKLTKNTTEPIITLFNMGLLHLIDEDLTRKYNTFLNECNSNLELISSKLSLGTIGELEESLNQKLLNEGISLKLKNFRLYWNKNSMDEHSLIQSFQSYYKIFLNEIAGYEKLGQYLSEFKKKISIFA